MLLPRSPWASTKEYSAWAPTVDRRQRANHPENKEQDIDLPATARW